MEKFLFIVREDLAKLKQYTEEQRYDAMREMENWVKGLVKKGVYLSGDALQIQGSYVSKDRILSDGPFIEAKEGISGYILAEAKDLRDAAAVAQTCPLVQRNDMAIEVRPIFGVKDSREKGDEPGTAGG